MFAAAEHRRRPGFWPRRGSRSRCDDEPADPQCTRFGRLTLYHAVRRQRRIHVARRRRGSDGNRARGRILDGYRRHDHSERPNRLDRLHPARAVDRSGRHVHALAAGNADTARLSDALAGRPGRGANGERIAGDDDVARGGRLAGSERIAGNQPIAGGSFAGNPVTSNPRARNQPALAQAQRRQVEIVLDRVINIVGDFSGRAHRRDRTPLGG